MNEENNEQCINKIDGKLIPEIENKREMPLVKILIFLKILTLIIKEKRRKKLR